MVLLKKRSSELDEIKRILDDHKSKADTAKAQIEFLLKQLKENFECESLDEAIELLEILTEDKKEIDKKIANKTRELIDKMKEEGFI